MTPLLLIAAGLVALVAAALTLRSYGARYRVGRLLAATPAVTVAEARRLAETGAPRYVRISGRIDAEDPFEDADHRPLVWRRTRMEANRDGRWTLFEDSREAVPFEIHEGLDGIGVDGDALDEGLVVVRRESEGVAGDLGERAPEGVPASTPVRATIEQVSAVEHAIVIGVPARSTEEGLPAMTAGLGRPLILTTLEAPEAMRILAGGTGRPRLVASLFAIGGALLLAGFAWAGVNALVGAVGLIGDVLIPVAYAATPTPAPGGDPRSSGEGPGLVGEPGIALLIVLGIAIASIVITTLYVRLTGGSNAAKEPAEGTYRT
ncbi:MAG TPA: hypothetical protein VFV72_05555 [Candidatus Limnocylindrales bacterium]|nr:hypothetical protein [Candidatus Limnocylindrales bacterium]